jgi:hypothetical protein
VAYEGEVEELRQRLTEAEESGTRARVWLAAVVSVAATTLIFILAVRPLSDDQLHSSLWSDAFVVIWTAGFLTGWVMIFVTTNASPHPPTTRALVIGSMLIPAITVVLAATRIDDHRYQRRALALFDAYTQRFAGGYLGRPYILRRDDTDVYVCARTKVGDHFCTEQDFAKTLCIDLSDVGGPKNDCGPNQYRGRVNGGFRYRSDDPGLSPAGNSFPVEKYDCFGTFVDEFCPAKS